MLFPAFFTKIFNPSAHLAIVEKNTLINELSLSDWFKKIPAGVYQTDTDEFINVVRDNNKVTITRTPNANGSDKSIFDTTMLCYDGMGFKYCYVQAISMQLFHRRYDAIDGGNNDKFNKNHINAKKTKDAKLKTLFAIRKIGEKFYNQEDVKIIVN
jgi:hypothetical protein